MEQKLVFDMILSEKESKMVKIPYLGLEMTDCYVFLTWF